MIARRPVLALAAVLVLAWACGADNAEAPQPPPAPQTCKSFQQLMPAFVQIIGSGDTNNLKQVVETYLVAQQQSGEPAAAADVLRALLGTMATFAAYPPDPGAPVGLVCVPDGSPPPPIAQANPLCEVRRAIYALVHQGKGLSTLQQVDPLLSGLLDYMVGRPPSSSTPHYEAAGAISVLCEQSAICSVNDTLDAVIGLTAFLQTSDGAKMLIDGNALVNNPEFRTYLASAESQDAGQSFGGEDGVVALFQVVVPIIQGLKQPSDLDNIPINLFPPSLQQDLTPLIADAKLLLDPGRQPNVLNPLKKILGCLNNEESMASSNYALIRMVYRLAFVANLPAFSLNGLTGTIQQLEAQTETFNRILYLVNLFAVALRNDATAAVSLGQVCNVLFDAQPLPGETQSNAELVLPAVATIFERGVASEAICAVDTLVYGCAGGSQPACPP